MASRVGGVGGYRRRGGHVRPRRREPLGLASAVGSGVSGSLGGRIVRPVRLGVKVRVGIVAGVGVMARL